VQSQRIHLYQTHAQRLLEEGKAYKCFCTDRTLELLRKEQARRREVIRYDNRCRSLSPDEVRQKEASGEPFCVRFKLDADSGSPPEFDDMVFGHIRHDVGQAEGDPVVLKADGFPTYHLANVVDDRLMEISHVFRGVEWQISTPKHILLYQ
jgi:glutamyl-tRNA synthetase